MSGPPDGSEKPAVDPPALKPPCGPSDWTWHVVASRTLRPDGRFSGKLSGNCRDRQKLCRLRSLERSARDLGIAGEGQGLRRYDQEGSGRPQRSDDGRLRRRSSDHLGCRCGGGTPQRPGLGPPSDSGGRLVRASRASAPARRRLTLTSWAPVRRPSEAPRLGEALG